MITDPIANFLCMINNAIMRKHDRIYLYSSKTILAMLRIMKDEGYIVDYVVKKGENNISYVTVYLKYKMGVSVIHGIKRISKPGHRVYCKSRDLPIIMNGMGTAIISTNRGIIDEKTSRRMNLGGEVMAYIW